MPDPADTAPVDVQTVEPSLVHVRQQAGIHDASSLIDQEQLTVGSIQLAPRDVRHHGNRDWSLAVVGPVEQKRLARGFGRSLSEARCRAGLTARELGRRAGCADSTISRLERGRRRPRPSLLASLCEVLDPDGSAGLEVLLTDLLGDSAREDSPNGLRRRRRRVVRAIQPMLESDLATSVAPSDAATAEAFWSRVEAMGPQADAEMAAILDHVPALEAEFGAMVAALASNLPDLPGAEADGSLRSLLSEYDPE